MCSDGRVTRKGGESHTPSDVGVWGKAWRPPHMATIGARTGSYLASTRSALHVFGGVDEHLHPFDVQTRAVTLCSNVAETVCLSQRRFDPSRPNGACSCHCHSTSARNPRPYARQCRRRMQPQGGTLPKPIGARAPGHVTLPRGPARHPSSSSLRPSSYGETPRRATRLAL